MNKTIALLVFPLLPFLLAACQSPGRPGENNSGACREPHRPQFHFSPPEKWMNDPNGMVFYDGEYHLFYQHYPDSNVWGPMHWGHAVSTDLVHWEHLPIALYPDSLGYIFSGSAVVDRNNTSGFGQDGKPPLVAIFTYHNMPAEKAGRKDFQYQGIAYSNDKGRGWTKYAGNPVVPNTGNIRDFRDPKVIWHEDSQQWIMVFAAYDHVKFWGSKDLKKWEHLSDFGKEWGSHGGVWECPDLFPLKVEERGETKWVLLLSINPGGPNGGSATQYFIGNFDGKSFTPDASFSPSVKGEKAVWLDYGRDNYAGVTWSDIPKEDGRRLFLGWMSNWDYAQAVPTEAWRSAMTLPRSLELRKTQAGYRLFSQPVRELASLRENTRALEPGDIQRQLDLTQKTGLSPAQMELILEFEPRPGAPADFGVELSNSKGERYRVGYNAATGRFYSDRTGAGQHAFSEKFGAAVHTAPRLSTGKTIRFHLCFDVASAELFADEGATVMTDIFFPTETFSMAKIYVDKGRVNLVRGEAWALKRIWD
ncbi:MAG: glycoside hydrolase family 32 protein [Thermoanaerobaculia bacterium]|nr:glycoside hydrolase family 32 protein [Thermoanaerobaculia bacterium]